MKPETLSASDDESVPREVVSPVLRRRLQECYERGTKLMGQDKYDFDHAHTLLVQCVIHDPGNLVYLDAFLENLHRKYNHNKRGALLHFGGKGPFKKAVSAENWPQVLRLGPEVLRTNPWDVSTLRAMAEACAASAHGETELRYLRCALDVKPHDPDVNRHCARSLARMGQFDQAIACWHRVDEALRGDQEAQHMMGELQIEKTLGRTPEVKPDRKSRKQTKRFGELKRTPGSGKPPASDAPREIKLTRRQELEQAVANRPTDLEAYFELADLHITEQRLADASHALTKAVAATGRDLKAVERLEDVEILRKQQQVAIAERQASGDDEQAIELAKQMRDDLNRYELEVFHSRAERYPADLEAKYQLGVRLKRVGNYREAISCFQESSRLSNRLPASLLELGECLQRLKRYEKALEYYQRAVAGASKDEQREVLLLARYRAGVLAAGLHNFGEAERQLGALVALEPTYKDAAPRLDNLRRMRHKK